MVGTRGREVPSNARTLCIHVENRYILGPVEQRRGAGRQNRTSKSSSPATRGRVWADSSQTRLPKQR